MGQFVENREVLYRFSTHPTPEGTGLLLKGVLEDKIASDDTEFADILFAEGFSIITDLKQGPDGNLYVVSGLKQSKSENLGAVYRIK